MSDKKNLTTMTTTTLAAYTWVVRWLMLVLVFVREKHCWLADLGWLKPINKQANYVNIQGSL